MSAAVAKKKWTVIKFLALAVLIVLGVAAIFLYNNYNRLLSEALLKAFNASVLSEVYELKFENLTVNLLDGNIKVRNVSLLPREKPVHEYPYINSSFRLRTDKLELENVEIRTLLKYNKLVLDKILIYKPDIEVMISGKRHIMLPFKDSTVVSSEGKAQRKKLDSFRLSQFKLIDADFHIINHYREREFKIKELSISIDELMLGQQPGEYTASFNQVALSIGSVSGAMQKGKLKQIGFNDFKIGIDSLNMQLTLDTLMYRFHDFNTGLRNLDIQTADSLFHVTMQSFDLSYKTQSINLKKISFEPNVSHAVLQRKYKYQHTEFSGSIGTMDFREVNFDSLIYADKLFIGEIVLDSVKASIFKDKSKPLDENKFPIYLGQTISTLKLPLRIGQLKAMHAQIENTERKPDNAQANVRIIHASVEVKNITNLSPQSSLIMNADAWLEGKAHFTVRLTFQYSKPQFAFEGNIQKFDLPDLSPLIQAYTPAKINKGVADEISFSGVAEKTSAEGTMKFLYHDLEVDLELHEKAKWKNSVLAFAANSVLDSSNPGASDLPPRIVKFKIERDMNKGFVNVIIKSLLNGLKETMIMSKENRKAYKESKREAKANKK